jgi:hypothetical protein
MMSNYERQLFSQLLEVNYRIETGNYDSIIKTALITHYHHLEDQIKESMGRNEYREFVDGMRKMFAPADGGYGDESPEEVARMMEAVR